MSPSKNISTLEEARKSLVNASTEISKLTSEILGDRKVVSTLKLALDEEHPRVKAVLDQLLLKDRLLRDSYVLRDFLREHINILKGQNIPQDAGTELNTMDSACPIVLLPVRIETRFVHEANSYYLKVRIFPDEIMIHSHEPPLSLVELDASKIYHEKTWNAGGDDTEAWAELTSKFPGPRAAWIVHCVQRSETGGFTVRDTQSPNLPGVAESHVLPDRWIVRLYESTNKVVSYPGKPITEPLSLSMRLNGVDPTDGSQFFEVNGSKFKIDKDIAWTVDYPEAKKIGMAVSIVLTKEQYDQGFKKVIVYGVRASSTPSETGALLQESLLGHHYSQGAAFIPQGTATNNTGDAVSGFSSGISSSDDMCPVERNRTAGLRVKDGGNFMKALGLDSNLALHFPNSTLEEQSNARAMNTLLSPVTIEYFLSQILRTEKTEMEPLFETKPANDPEIVSDLQRYYVNHVRGRGHYPAFRVGSVPYGLLPVSSLELWKSEVNEPLGDRIVPTVLKRIVRTWYSKMSQVPHVGMSGDPDDVLLKVLGMDASAREFFVRFGHGSEFGNEFSKYDQHKKSKGAEGRPTAFGEAFDIPKWYPTASSLQYHEGYYRFAGNLVTNGNTSELDAGKIDWIKELWKTNLEDLRDDQWPNGRAMPLAYYFLKQSALLFADHMTLEYLLLTKHAKVSPEDRFDREMVHSKRDRQTTPWERFQILASNQSLKNISLIDYIMNILAPKVENSRILSDRVKQFLTAMNTLDSMPSAELERVFTESVDTTSHRLDAWISSLSAKRLAEIRSRPSSGSYMGAYGWAFDVRPAHMKITQGEQMQGGYIHAPSMDHAAAAGVLRSGYLSQKKNPINLNSSRVRKGLRILDAIREGQPLGAVLGYLLERALHESTADELLVILRKIFNVERKTVPLNAAGLDGQSAGYVIDGLKFLNFWRTYKENPSHSRYPFLNTDIDPTNTALSLAWQTWLNGPMKECEELNDAFDSITDLLTAESVYQMVRGNASGVSAAFDAMSNGSSIPRPEVTDQPRSGEVFTNRFAVLLNDQIPLHANWTSITVTPRACAEPKLDRWLGVMMGDPQNVIAKVSFINFATDLVDTKTVTLAQLGLRPIDILASLDKVELSQLVILTAFDDNHVIEAKDIRVQFGQSGWSDSEKLNNRSFEDMFVLLKEVNQLMEKARILKAEDLHPVGYKAIEAEASSIGDGETRADRLKISIETLKTGLRNADSVKTRRQFVKRTICFSNLKLTSLAGMDGSRVWTPESAELGKNVLDMESALTALLKTMDDVGTGFISKTQILFGEQFKVIPSFSTTVSFYDVPQSKVSRWQQKVSQVRMPLNKLRKINLVSGLLANHRPYSGVIQYATGATKWIGENSANLKHGSVSIVLQNASTQPSPVWCGFLLDEWNEVMPSAVENTGVAFHFDNPGAEAPQTILVAVHPDLSQPKWSPEVFTKILEETMDLAKMRAVDLEALGELSQVLPSIYFSTSDGTKPNEVISTQFAKRVKKVNPKELHGRS